MKRLFVWVHGPEGTIRLAGELATTDTAPGEWVAKFPSQVRAGRGLELIQTDVRRRLELIGSAQ
jgi:hypothetical protein